MTDNFDFKWFCFLCCSFFRVYSARASSHYIMVYFLAYIILYFVFVYGLFAHVVCYIIMYFVT